MHGKFLGDVQKKILSRCLKKKDAGQDGRNRQDSL